MYSQLASWWHILSAPDDYREEARTFTKILRAAVVPSPRTLLEMGSGGGNNASHMKAHFEMTLADLSPGMLQASRGINPELPHIEGDMRTLRLGREFDAVFVHDAVTYLTRPQELREAMTTAFVHCRPGGAALFVPDHVRESFRPETKCGGHDGPGRSLRYLEWVHDPDPADSTYLADFAFLLREEDGSVRVESDRHLCGLFPRQEWVDSLHACGFAARVIPEPYGRDMFLGLKPAE